MSTSPAGRSASEIEFAPLGIGRSPTGRSIDIARFALSLWKPMAVGLLAGCVLGVLAYLYMGPVYQASTRIKVSQKATAPLNAGEARRYGDRAEHVHLIMSDAICSAALNDHGLKDLPAFKGAYDAVKDIIEGLSARRTAGLDTSFDNLIDIAYQHPDKVVAKKVVEAVVAAYDAYLIRTRNANSLELFDNLTSQLALAEESIHELEEDYLAWRNESPFFYSTPMVATLTGQLMPGQSPYQVELEKLRDLQRMTEARRVATEAKITTLEEMLRSGLPPARIQSWVMFSLASSSGGEQGTATAGPGLLTTPPGKAELDSQYLSARLLEHRLKHILGDEHNDVQNVHRQVQAIRAMYQQQGLTPPPTGDLELDAESQQGADLASVYLNVLRTQLRDLANEKRLLAQELVDAEAVAKTGLMLDKRDQDWKDNITARKKYRTDLLTRLAAFEQTRDQEGYRLEQIAQVRIERSLKRVLKIVGAFGLIGLIVVFGLAYFREWYDTSVRSLEEITVAAGAPVIGAVPKFRYGPDSPRHSHYASLHPRLCYYHNPGSREAESYRSVRTSLFFTTQENGAKLIQVSSAEPGDGKTTSTCNLAMAIAQSGKRVLLIDADLRRPTVHELFRLSQEVGLAEVLLGEIEWRNALKSTPVDSLNILTAGVSPESPAELLSTARLAQVLKEARAEFDFILVDSPPVLAVSDPCIISPHTDGMLLVVRMEKNKRASVQRTRETLDSHGVRLFGVIANDFNAQSNRDGYNYDSYSAYYAGTQATGEPAIRDREALVEVP